MNSLIINPSSSAHDFVQSVPGWQSSHTDHPFARVATAYGYTYVHTTPILGEHPCLCHAFRRGNHTVSFATSAYGSRDGEPSKNWHTSTGSGSGRRHHGSGGSDLACHLASKARRYNH